ncbi:helix-turn-helix transcriptional regulator [Atopobiaceae bacterium HCP3S3_A4]
MSESTARNMSKLRQLSGMTQEDFARIADVSRGAVAQWERGFAEPRMGNIQRLSDYFRIPKAWIIEDGGMDGVRIAAGILVKDPASEVDEQEATLIGLYRSMSEDGRAALLASARGLAMAYPGEAAQAGVSRSA